MEQALLAIQVLQEQPVLLVQLVLALEPAEQPLTHGQAKLVLLVMREPLELPALGRLQAARRQILGRVSLAQQVMQVQPVLQDPDLLLVAQPQTRGQVRQEPLDLLVLLAQMEQELERVVQHQTYGQVRQEPQERLEQLVQLVPERLQAARRQILGRVSPEQLAPQEILDQREPEQTQEQLEQQTQVLQEILDQQHLQRIILPPRYIHIRK